MSEKTPIRPAVEEHLRKVILPFWEGLADIAMGGYTGYVGYDLKKKADAVKGCILHSRILWFFSTALRVLGDGSLRPFADRAYEALLRMRDKENGGMYWSMTPDFGPFDTTKHTYCQAFAVYGLSAYAMITENSEALVEAMKLFELIENRCRDGQGYLEAFRSDFGPESNEKLSENGVSASRTMNTLLHVTEAYTELYRACGDERVRSCLLEQLDIWEKRVYNPVLRRQEVFFGPGYETLIDLTSYGHDIEASWLLDRTLDTLGDEALTARVRPRLLDLARRVRAEAYTEGNGTANEKERGRTDEKRVWWVQAEALLGWLNAWRHGMGGEYLDAARDQWRYILARIWDHRDGGEWFWYVEKDGTPGRKPIAEPWKCPYHNGRMALEVIGRREYENV